MDPIFFRAAERLIVVLSGLVCIVLGYRLFHQSYATVDKTNAEMIAKGGGFELALRNVWPGAFFAAFGMIVLVTSILTQLKTQSPGPEPASAATVSYQGGGLPPTDSKTRASAAISAIGDLLMLEAKPPSDIEVRRATALNRLSTSQVDLVDIAYGSGSYARFNDIMSRSKIQKEYDALSTQDKQFFEDLKTVLQR